MSLTPLRIRFRKNMCFFKYHEYITIKIGTDIELLLNSFKII